MSTVLVTGVAGFIGYHLAERLLREGRTVIGIDNLNDYYDVTLKEARLAQLEGRVGFTFQRLDLTDSEGMRALFAAHKFDIVFNMGAQAGVRYSLVNPEAYVSSNVSGFLNVLEGCRHHRIGHLVFASSSSVYGANTQVPFSTHHHTDHPVSLYAATKKANELMAHTYAHLYGVPATGLRFFTVYGPWGRPDMALYLFTRAMLAGEPINVFNNGAMERDFTYIDDVVEGVVRVGDRIAAPNPGWRSDAPDPASAAAPYRLYNIGNHAPVQLGELIAVLERALGVEAIKNMLPMQPGDVPATYADVDDLARDVDFAPRTPIEVGVQRFVDWYREYHRV
ncbi:MAG TPA: NAD-dependent epimerase [Terricaulis sp.]|nr:NAD-dependent epimerase [Terricaulis sp.]HRP10417.1 NAD-dependent epimerase [Terricaulis sp.]